MARVEAKAEGTLDDIVRRSLTLASEVERAAKLASRNPEGSLAAARLANAAAALHRQAISALKARSTTGDILPVAKGTAKGAPAAAAPPPEYGLEALRDGLNRDRDGLNS